MNAEGQGISKSLWPETCHGRWMSERYEPGLASVIIPTYNRARLLTEAMDSVLAQTYRPIELIVVDDGSTDHTRKAIEQWSSKCADDHLFRLSHFHQGNKGAPAARNLGLVQSHGEYIQFLDSDDILHPEKIERQAAELRECPALPWTSHIPRAPIPERSLIGPPNPILESQRNNSFPISC